MDWPESLKDTKQHEGKKWLTGREEYRTDEQPSFAKATADEVNFE
jgi:hypothetical protein